MSKKIRVGIAGLDHFYAGLAAVRELAANPDAELVLIAHRDKDRARETADQAGAKWTTNYAEVVNANIDLLITACPTNQNAELVIEAAKQGKHILSVKPFAMNLAEADEILAAVKTSGVRFMSFDANYRVSPLYQQYKDWLQEGKMGKPVSAFCLLRAPMPEISWFGAPFVRARTWWLDPEKVPGGGWIDHAIYYVDALRWLFDTDVERVSGEIAHLKHPDELLEDFGVATMVLKNGVVATLEVTWTAELNGAMSGFHLVGTGGQVLAETTTKGILMGIEQVTEVKRIDYADPILGWQKVEPLASQDGLTTHMVAVLRGDAEPMANEDDSRAALAACLAFYRAAQELRAVTL